MAVAASKPVTNIDTLAAILAIQKVPHKGVAAVPILLDTLATAEDMKAAVARDCLFALVPMAALPLRWPAHTAAHTAPENLPASFKELCQGWIDDAAFAEMCVAKLIRLSRVQQNIFLNRLTAFQGLEQALSSELLKRGLRESLRFYTQKMQAWSETQFPPQLSVSLTMACQLKCAYCISAGLSSDAETEMPFSQAEKLVAWSARKGVRRIGFTGGEPTLYSRFAEMLDLLQRMDMQWYLATNGLANSRCMERIASHAPLFVTLHLAPETLHDPRLLEIYIRNARLLVENKTAVAMRVNFGDPHTVLEPFLDIANRTGIDEIRAAIPVPNAGRRNQYVRFDQPEKYGALLGRFVDLAQKHAVRPILTKPFFPCKLPSEALRTFLSNGSFGVNCPVHLNDFANNMIVYPDASFLPCLGLSLRSNRSVFLYGDLKGAASTFRDAVRSALLQPPLAECPSCPMWQGGRCIGVCPSYRVDGGASAGMSRPA